MRFYCDWDQHNDVATLFLSSTHHTIVKLFSMGKIDKVRTGCVTNAQARFASERALTQDGKDEKVRR